MVNKRALGGEKELIAAEYLRNNGYKILQMNFRCKTGEIDIVALDGDTLVFCEVKYRTRENYGHPLEAVTSRKQQKIIQTTRYYILINNISDEQRIRFDVIGILGDKITHVRNAF